MARILNNDSLPSEKSIQVDIRYSVSLAKPTGFGVSNITSTGFRADVDAGPSGSAVMFEIKIGSVWSVTKSSTDTFAVFTGLSTSATYQLRAHYIVNGVHSQYAFANVTTLGA